jgi:hypothetical protein
MIKQFNKVGIYSAIISFAIGTLLLISFAITHIELIAVIGYFFLIIAFYVNLFIAVILLIMVVVSQENTFKNLRTIIVMLINLPIAYLYYVIVFTYLIH